MKLFIALMCLVSVFQVQGACVDDPNNYLVPFGFNCSFVKSAFPTCELTFQLLQANPLLAGVNLTTLGVPSDWTQKTGCPCACPGPTTSPDNDDDSSAGMNQLSFALLLPFLYYLY
jgi:hypothetical protein